MNKRQIEALIKCGVFDSLGVFRSKLLAKYEEIIDNLLNEKKVNIAGQVDLFSDFQDDDKSDSKSVAVTYPDIPELSMHAKLAMEKESAGRYFSGHPIDDYTQALQKLKSISISSVIEYFDEENEESGTRDKFVTTAGIAGDINIKRTRNGDDMAFFTLEDEFSAIEIVVFPKKYAQFGYDLNDGEIMAINGNISPGREENPKIYLNNIIKLEKNSESARATVPDLPHIHANADSILAGGRGEPLQTASPVISSKSILYIKVPAFDEDNIIYKKAINLIEIFEGANEVKIYDASTKKIYSRKNPGADLNPAFISELKNILGEENVKIT